MLILGKLPPPYFGPAVATQILLNSDLKNQFDLTHFNTKINDEISGLGQWSWSKTYKLVLLYRRYYLTLRAVRPDLVLIPISQSTGGFIKDSFFILFASCFTRHVLLHLRGSQFGAWYKSAGGPVKAFTKWVLSRAYGAIVLGQKLICLFENFYPRDRIFVVPNGADYQTPSRSKDEGKVKIVYLSNFFPSKGIQDVIQAMGHLTTDLRDQLQLHAFGQWADESFKNVCLKLTDGLAEFVGLYGGIAGDRKFKVLVDADLFVFPPREPEGHPWVIVEALAAGLPIISTDQGAITESVIDGWNGFIVEPRRPEQIAEKIQYLIEHPQERQRMGENSRRHYEANFTEEKMVRNLANCFRSILTEARYI